MEFPVDVLANVDPESLEHSAKDYMSKLLYRNPEKHEYLSISGSEKIEIGLCNVGFVPLHGANIIHKVLALFSPEEKSKAVGLYLHDQWWSAEDILKTADPTRTGLLQVKTTGERIVLYVLNRIIYRTKERADGDVDFLCHGKDEFAKILWKNGEAVGFYSVKPEGALCSDYLTQRYELPIMDSIFIRNCHRRKGYGLQMLEDFVRSFQKDCMGLRCPLSLAMYKVCKKYLSLHPQDTEFLWETEGVGCTFQRTPIARKLQAMDLNENQWVMGNADDDNFQMDVSVDLVERTLHYTEDVEEVVQVKIRKVAHDTDVTTYCSSCCLKQTKLGTDTEVTTDEQKRTEDVEPEVHVAENDLVHEDGALSLIKDTVEAAKPNVTTITEISHVHRVEQNVLSSEPFSYSETEIEQVPPLMEIQNNQDAQTSEVVIVPEEGQTSAAESSYKTNTEEAGKISVVENIVDETEEIEVEKKEAGALEVSLVEKKKNTEESDMVPECSSEKLQEIKDQEPRITSEKALTATSKHVYTRQTQSIKNPEEIKQVLREDEPQWEGSNQTESQAEPTGKQQVEEIAENESVEGSIKSVNVTTEFYSENLIATLKEKEIHKENTSLDQQTNNTEVENDIEDGNKMPEKSRNEEPDKETSAAPADVGETTKYGEEIVPVDVHFETSEKIIDVKSQDSCALVHSEEQEEESSVPAVPAADGKSEGAASNKQKNFDIPVNVTDNESVLVVKDKTETLNVEEPDVTHDRVMENILSKDDEIVLERNLTDASKIAEAQEDEPMKEPEIVQTSEEQVLTLVIDETQMEVFQKEKTPKETNSVQDTHEEDIKPITESSEDDERVKLDVQIELSEASEDETSCVTPVRQMRKLKHQAAESELTTRVLRSTTKAAKTNSKTNAAKQQITTKQIDNFESEHMMDVQVSHDETGEEELVSSITEMKHVKSVEIDVGAKTSEQPAAEHVEVLQDETGLGTSEDGNAEEEAILTCATDVHLDFDKGLTPAVDGEAAMGIIQAHEEEDLVTHKPQTLMSLQQSLGNESDEKEKSTEGVVLNDGDKVPESTITDETLNTVEKEADAGQETPSTMPNEENESETSKVLTKLDEKDEAKATPGTSLRRSIRQQGQAAESELNKRVLGSSANLTSKGKEQIKNMMLQEDPGQLDEAKNKEMNIISGTEAAVREHMGSVTVHVFAEVEPENMTLSVQRTLEEEGSLDKDYIKTDDHEHISHGNQVEENLRQDITEAEHLCTPFEKSAEGIEHSEAVKEVKNKIQEDRAVKDLVHGEKSEGVMETTSRLTLQEASVVLVDVKNVLPNLTVDWSPAQEVFSDKHETSEQAMDMTEEMREAIQTEVVEGDMIEKEFVNPIEGEPADRNTTAKDTAEEDSNVGHLKDGTNDTIELQEKKSPDKMMEEELKTGQFTLQDPILTQDSVHRECSETTMHAQDVLDLNNTEVVIDPISVEEREVDLTSTLALERQMVGNERGNETAQSQEVELLAKTHYADEESASVQMDIIQPVTERIGEENEEAGKLGTDNTLITHGKQDKAISPEESTKGVSTEKSTSAEFETNNTLTEGKASTTPEHGDSARESSKDISVCISKDPRRRTLPAKLTPESKARRLRKESKAHEYTEEEISDEEVETVFMRHLRRRTITITVSPRRRSKHITNLQEAEPGHETEVRQEKLTVQSTEVDRTSADERQETCAITDNQEVYAISETERKEEQQAKTIAENDSEEEDGRKATIEETEVEVRSANSEQEREQYDDAREETFERELAKTVDEKHFEEKDWSTQITEPVPDQSEDGTGRRILRKRTITTKAVSVRKSKRQFEQDQDGQINVWPNTGDSATIMAGVKSPAENQATDQCQEKEDVNNMGGKNAGLVAVEYDHGEENRGQQSTTEETACENNSSKASNVTYEHKQIVATQEEPELCAKIAEEMTEGSVSGDEIFTLELDEELDHSDAGSNQVTEETKAQESEKQITEQDSGEMTPRTIRGRKSATASAEQRSTRSSRLLKDRASEMKNRSESEEVKKVIRGEGTTPQQKRQAEVELTPRRSKRLARANIM